MSRNDRKNSVDSLILLAASHVSIDFSYSGRSRKPNFLCDDALIYDRLQKAALACENIDNIYMLAELKNLIEESIELFRVCHRLDDTRQQLSPVSVESPSSSMYPQLGVVEKKVLTAPNLDTGDYMVPELSVLSIDTDENNDVRQSCINFKPILRLGNQLALLFCNPGRHEAAQSVEPIPGSEAPLSPSLQFFISRHRAPPPTLPLQQLAYQENCRSTDAECDNNEIRYWTVDDSIPELLNGEENVNAEKRHGTVACYHNAEHWKKPPPIKSLQSETRMRSLSKAHKVLLLETATAIGLSLCQAFLIWKKALLQYLRRYHITSASDAEAYTAPHAHNSRGIYLTHSDRDSHPLSSTRSLAISTGLQQFRGHPADDDGDSQNYDCDSNNGSNCDSNSSCDIGICGGNCANGSRVRSSSSTSSTSSSSSSGSSRSSAVSPHNYAQDGDMDIVKDPSEVVVIYDNEENPVGIQQKKHQDSEIRKLRHSARQHSRHKDEGKWGSEVSDTGDNSEPDAMFTNQYLTSEKNSPRGGQGKWLNCLNTSDVLDWQTSEESNGLPYRIQDEAFDGGDTYKREKHRKNHRGALVPACITRVDASDSDSDSEAELKLCSRSTSQCYRAPPAQFAESNPISKLLRPRNKNRSVSFDGGCMPTQLFDRRKRSLSIPLAIPGQVRMNCAIEISTASPPLDSPPQRQFESSGDSSRGSGNISSIASDTSSSFTFNSGFDYRKCVAFINESKCTLMNASSMISSPISPKSMNSFDPPGIRDCFGTLREPLVLHSHLPARQEQYRAIGPVVRTNELALWAIFAQFPITCCDINHELSASALAVHNYSSNRPLLSFANLRALLSSFGICPAICSESELSEHLKEMKIATSPPSSPFFVASPIKVCSFESFVKILWLVASERMLMTAANTTVTEIPDLQSQVRFAMILHQMDISEGRANLSRCLMKSSINSHIREEAPPNECLSPMSPVSKTFREPLLPLPPFDLSVLKETRTGTAARKMLVCEAANKSKMKMKKKMIAKFNTEISSGIATDSSSLSDF